jgi:hypothetical protein
MARAFDSARPGKGFPHALGRLRDFLAGGQVNDFEDVVLPGVGPTAFTPLTGQAKKLRVRTTGGAVAHDLDLSKTAVGALELGHRLHVVYLSEVTAGASVTITEGANVVIQTLGMAGETPAGVASITMDAAADEVLLEYQGLVGADDVWNVLYVNSAVIA